MGRGTPRHVCRNFSRLPEEKTFQKTKPLCSDRETAFPGLVKPEKSLRADGLPLQHILTTPHADHLQYS